MREKETLVAIVYDFDKTLCDKDMQDYSFIPSLGMETDKFWEVTDFFVAKEKMDKILGCMYMMLNEAKKNNKYITKKYLNSLGNDVNFFDGLEEWFERINEYGARNGLTIEHYIISSGLREIIKGTNISNVDDI